MEMNSWIMIVIIVIGALIVSIFIGFLADKFLYKSGKIEGNLNGNEQTDSNKNEASSLANQNSVNGQQIVQNIPNNGMQSNDNVTPLPQNNIDMLNQSNIIGQQIVQNMPNNGMQSNDNVTPLPQNNMDMLNQSNINRQQIVQNVPNNVMQNGMNSIPMMANGVNQGKPIPFDGNISGEENINNMF